MSHALRATSPLTPPPLASLTSFIGREREVAAIAEQLASARLVTLTGAGGSGKTRLASEVFRSVTSRFRDGAVWIELAAITEPDLVLGHLAASLGIGGTGRPPADALRDALRDSERLIALDNCEQVIQACASAAELILRHCPGVRILATSREALGIAGERAWLVPLLSLPDADDTLDAIASADAVRLFVERARAANANFVLTEANAGAVVEVCRRLDGLPLALELAAARARALTPEQMLTRLGSGLHVLDTERRGAAARHRTLRATIDWSWDLLAPDEQLLLRRLSVFADEFALEAAEAVCPGDGIAAGDVLDLLAALVDKSLVVVQDRADEARYYLLETIRQYGRERLDASPGEAERARARHAAFYTSLIREAEPHFITPSRPAWVERVGRELDDIRLVLVWTRAHDHATHVELVGRLGWYWYSSGLWTEGRRWLEDALALPEAQEATARRAAVLFGAAVIASLQGDVPTARGWLEESGAIARATGDRSLAAYSDSYIGVALGQEGQAAAEAPSRAALAWFEQSGDLYGQRLALIVMATLFVRQGRLEEAARAASDGVRVARAYGLGRELGIALQVQATVHLQRRELDASAATIAEALRSLRDDPQPFWLARAMELMGVVECARGHPLHGARLFGAAERRRERMGATLFRLDRERLAPVIDAARAAAGSDRFDAAWTAGRAEPFDRVVEYAIDAAGHGAAPVLRVDETSPAAASHQPLLQVRLFGRLSVVRDGAPLSDETWKYARPREMLAFLLVHRDGCTREQLRQALWPDASIAQAKNNVHVTLHHLRRALGQRDLILFDRDRYVINWSLGVEVDVVSFEREVEEALRVLRANARSSEAAERLLAALDGYRGDFLADETVGDWHLELRGRLQRLRADGLAALGSHYVAAGENTEAVQVYRQLVQADEWDERAQRELMMALARSGQRGDALRQYDRLAARLATEMEAEPAPETTMLYDRLRRGDIGD